MIQTIVKAHGGEIKVETENVEGAQLTVQLPITKF
jgi:signal transduction histidine kinase